MIVDFDTAISQIFEPTLASPDNASIVKQPPLFLAASQPRKLFVMGIISSYKSFLAVQNRRIFAVAVIEIFNFPCFQINLDAGLQSRVSIFIEIRVKKIRYFRLME